MVHRWMFVATAVCVATLAAAAPPAATAPEVPVAVVSLGGPLHMLRVETPIGNPTSVASVGPDGILIVDPNLLMAHAAIRDALAKLGDGPVRYVLCSHAHGDHAEGFEKFTDGVGVVPTAQRERLATGEIVFGERPIKAEALPQVTFDAEITLHFNGDAVRAFTPPNRASHTDGDAFVHFPRQNVLYVGDHLFIDRFPFVDVDSGGDLDGYLANVRWVGENFSPSTVIVPGHSTFHPAPARTLTNAEYQGWRERLETSIVLIRAMHAKGMSVEKAQKKGLPKDLAQMGAKPRFVSADNWIAFVYATIEASGD